MTDASPIAAAIDIGSNSIKMTIARPNGHGGIDQVAWASETVRLGQGVDETGRLDDERIEVALETLRRFAARAGELGARTVVAVATEAARVASNGAAFVDRVNRETGIDARIIDGREEAELTFRGLAATEDVSGQVVIADIGGASTELIVAEDGVMRGARSVPLGSGRLTDRLGLSDPPSRDQLTGCEAEAGQAIDRGGTSLAFPRGGNVRLIIVGGTGEFMACVVPNPEAIDRQGVEAALGKLTVLTAAELADAIEIPEARARVLPAGVAIVAAIADRIQPRVIEVAPSGVRAGLLVDAFAGEPMGIPPHASREHEASGGPPKKTPWPIEPQRDAQPVAEPDFREAMKSLIADGWQNVWEAIPAALEGTDSEGVHDVRVASRRLRAAMDVGAPIFPHRGYKRLHRAAKEITKALGHVRDRDVMLAVLRADREMVSPIEQPAIDLVIARVEREREQAFAEMERYLQALLDSPLSLEVERRFGRGLERDASPETGSRGGS